MRKAWGFIVVFLFLLVDIRVQAFNLPSYKELCRHLQDLSGWQAEDCDGMNINTPMGEMVSAQRPYSKGDKSIEIAIFYGMQAANYWAPFTYQMEMDSNDEYMKTTVIDGFPVGIDYHKKDHSGAIIVCLENKTPTNIAIFVLNFNNMHWKEALKIAKQFDWKAIKKTLAPK